MSLYDCPFQPDVFLEEVVLTDGNRAAELAGETPAYIEGFSWRVYTEDLFTATAYRHPKVRGEAEDVTYVGQATDMTIDERAESAVIYIDPPQNTLRPDSEDLVETEPTPAME